MKRTVSAVVLAFTLAMPAVGMAAPKQAIREASWVRAVILWVTNVTGISSLEKSVKVVGRDTNEPPTDDGSTTIDANG